MKKKILGKKLSLNKKKLEELNDSQMAHFLGGRMAASTAYTATGSGNCSSHSTDCCSQYSTDCCS